MTWQDARRSGATDERAKEAGLINKSLSALGRVINAIVDKTVLQHGNVYCNDETPRQLLAAAAAMPPAADVRADRVTAVAAPTAGPHPVP